MFMVRWLEVRSPIRCSFRVVAKLGGLHHGSNSALGRPGCPHYLGLPSMLQFPRYGICVVFSR